MSSNIRFDKGELRKPKVTKQGFLRADGYATRVGVFEYRLPSGAIQREYRPQEEVFKADSLESLANVPLTNDHPPEMVTADNAMQYSVGSTGDKAEQDGIFVKTALTIHDAAAIKAVKDKAKAQLSCGYTCDLEMQAGEFEGVRYDAIQRNIIYNHLALVPVGRAGPEARVHMDSTEGRMVVEPRLENPKGEPMPMAKIKIDSVEYEIPEGVAKVVADKIDAAAALQKQHEELKAKLDTAAGELEAKKTEIEQIKKAAHKKDDCLGIAKARLELEAKGKAVLGADEKLDAMDDMALKKAMVKKLKPELNLDGVSEDFLNGFLVNISTAKNDSLPEDLANHYQDSAANSGSKFQTARQKMIQEARDGWKSQAN